MEACLREALGLALWDQAAQCFDAAKLPPDADPVVRHFFNGHSSPGGAAASLADAGSTWYDIVSGREEPSLLYMLGKGPTAYELFPSIDNFVECLRALLRVPVRAPPGPLQAATVGQQPDGLPLVVKVDGQPATPEPVWPGAPIEWQRGGCHRAPVLLLRRSAGDEMRIVFNGQRHCYSLRDAAATEPAWVSTVRHAWRQRLLGHGPALPPEAAAAAARLLGLKAAIAEAPAHATLVSRESDPVRVDTRWNQ